MRFTIGLKVFSIAVGLLLLMAVVALLSMRMTRIVDDQLVIIDQNYFPAYVALAQANIRSVEESAYVRRLLLALAEQTDDAAKVDDLRRRVASAAKASDELIAGARRHINDQIADPLDFDDNVALARLDVRVESLQEERRRYEAVLSKLLAATEAHQPAQAGELLAELDGWLHAHLPPESRVAIVHNDFRIGNMIVNMKVGSIAAVLDWELATIGDPLADLGYFLTSYPGPGEPLVPTSAMGTAVLEPGYPERAELLDRYADRTGADVSGVNWYAALAMYKLAALYEYSRRRFESGVGDPYYADPGLVSSFLAAGEQLAAADSALT